MSSVSSRGDDVARQTHSHSHWNFELIIREQPVHSRMCGVGERVDRRPIDPPPIVQLKIVGQDTTNMMDSLQAVSPYIFLAAVLVPADHTDAHEGPLQIDFHRRLIIGRTVSSLYLLRDLDNTEGAFFVFSDMSVRADGRYRLRMCLFEMQESAVRYRQSVLTDPFIVYSAKKFPGMHLSCPLACHFAEQGLKIRIRKESRKRSMLTLPRSGNQSTDDGGGGNASRSSTSSQKRSPHTTSGVLEETPAEDASSSSAAASTPPPYHYVNRRNTEDQGTQSIGNLPQAFDSPSEGGATSQPSTMASSSQHHGSAFMDTTANQQSTTHVMDTTAQPYWTLPPLSSFENNQHASGSSPLSQHLSEQRHHTPSYYNSTQQEQHQQRFNPSIHHHHHQHQHLLSSPSSPSSTQGGALLINPSLHPPINYRAPSSPSSAATGPSTAPPPPPQQQHTAAGPRIEWRSERPELILHTSIPPRRSSHPADQHQQPTVLPSLREQLERIGMMPPPPSSSSSSSSSPSRHHHGGGDNERWKS